MAKTLSKAALEVLDRVVIDGHIVRIGQQLERPLYTEVNKALECLGGKWDRKAQGHVFPEDPQDAIEQVVIDGAFSDTKRDFDVFETPVKLAQQMVQSAHIETGHRVLEPSAGTGRIADAIAATKGILTCIEIQPKLVGVLRKKGYKPLQQDFLTYKGMQFDRIIMNPPFSKGQDIAHVTHALSLLKPGGCLVAVLSAGVLFRQTKAYKAFRDMAENSCSSTVSLPPNTFKESGTSINTVLFTFIKHKAAKRVAKKTAPTLGDEIDALEQDANREMLGNDADYFDAAGITDIGNK
jgi:predicted RNA methylase